jgi:hypothetical protein
MADTFYKKNVISFENETFTDLAAFLPTLFINNVDNINLDSRILHRSVFKYLSSELGVKKYILVTFLISSSLSWIKGFKYQINYFFPSSSFPRSNELDILGFGDFSPSRFKDFYFVFNSISDLVNYLVFVVVSIVFDVSMVVQLRRTLEVKAKKSESITRSNEIMADNDEVVNREIKMVVLNSLICVVFKLPVCFMPLLNVYAQFYFMSAAKMSIFKPDFGDFYSMLIESEFYALIQCVSHLLYMVSLSIHLFVYKHKKFRSGYEKLIS